MLSNRQIGSTGFRSLLVVLGLVGVSVLQSTVRRFSFLVPLVFVSFGLYSCSTVVDGNAARQTPDARSLNETPDSGTPIVAPDAAPPAPCIEGDRRVEGPDGTCYMLFFSTPQNWTSAQSSCLGLSANLVSITDLAEQTVVGGLAGMVPGNTPDIWTGANDQVTEGAFLWVDATPFTYTHWRSGEPNDNGPNGTGEDCMLIEGDNGAREWDDRSCAGLLPYMCERKPSTN
ncbi:MAG: C-type lectin domain-containing protein [Kofleriaceae bacterium]|nr:C-type lectin domain-containing protein [Kofleriaceae bacterium]